MNRNHHVRRSLSEGDFKSQLIGHLPQLRAFARALTGNRDNADDLVQDTMARALAARDKFESGTNLRAWLMTILRNQRITHLRRHRVERACLDGLPRTVLHAPPAQHATAECGEVVAALGSMAPAQREALMLVTAAGLSYEEAAQVCDCAIGTVKSRVNRARSELQRILAAPRALPAPRPLAGFGHRRSLPGSRRIEARPSARLDNAARRYLAA